MAGESSEGPYLINGPYHMICSTWNGSEDRPMLSSAHEFDSTVTFTPQMPLEAHNFHFHRLNIAA